jgi:predicted RNA-binding protein
MNQFAFIMIVLNFICAKELVLNCNIFKHNIYNIRNSIRNNTLRYIIFKESKIIHFLRNLKKNTQIYYNKIIVSVNEGIEKYNNLSDEDKMIIDTIRDLIL